MRHNVAYTFTNEERNIIGDLLLRKMDEISAKYDYDTDKMTGRDKDEYTKLYNLYIQF